MSSRHLLKLPLPQRRPLPPPRVPASQVSHEQQVERHSQTFSRLEQFLRDLPAYRHDPNAIVPERALVFVVKKDAPEFSRLLYNLSGREILEEEEIWELDADAAAPASHVYLTMPTEESLHKLLALWKNYAAGKPMRRGYGKWKDLFAHLDALRPWGPRDQLTEEAVFQFRKILRGDIRTHVRVEAEIWYRGTKQERHDRSAGFEELIARAGGNVLDQIEIEEIAYLGALAEVRREILLSFLDNPDNALKSFQMVKFIVPQTQCDQHPESLSDPTARHEPKNIPDPAKLPLVALLDGVPMSEHSTLQGRLLVDDPDNFEKKYPRASQRLHGTSMASAIIYGDLNSQPAETVLTRKLYVRPIMHPPSDDAKDESLPTDTLYLDLVQRAFARMFGAPNVKAEAPTVCLVNFSIGNRYLPFSRSITPWARLLDHLASKYNVLILVSAGNSPDPLALEDISWDALKRIGPAEREGLMTKALYENKAQRRLLSPSESINSLTIGAYHRDALSGKHPAENILRLHQDSHLPNMTSSMGLGYMRSIKPDMLFPGGREHVERSPDHEENRVIAVSAGKEFGIGTSVPPQTGTDPSRLANYCGTSVATALATRSACKILESILDTPQVPPHPDPDPQFFPVIAKTLLVHSARWEQVTRQRLTDILNSIDVPTSQHRDEVTRIIGFGVADTDRATHCTPSRATLLGWGFMPANEIESYAVPLPHDLSEWPRPYHVTVTCAWITPIEPRNKKYRVARISVKLPKPSDMPSNTSCESQPTYRMCGRGTVFHQHLDIPRRHRSKTRNNLVVELHHKMLPNRSDPGVPYALAVTIEDDGLESVKLYDLMRDAITIRVGG